MSEFLDEEHTRVLLILGDSLEISTAMPSKIPSKGRVIYWLKRQAGVVRIDAVRKCTHVNLVRKTNVAGEEEYLFAP